MTRGDVRPGAVAGRTAEGNQNRKADIQSRRSSRARRGLLAPATKERRCSSRQTPRDGARLVIVPGAYVPPSPRVTRAPQNGDLNFSAERKRKGWGAGACARPEESGRLAAPLRVQPCAAGGGSSLYRGGGGDATRGTKTYPGGATNSSGNSY